MADCPDVHGDMEPRFTVVPASVVVAAEYFAMLSAEKQRELRALESRGELRIMPQSEMSRVR